MPPPPLPTASLPPRRFRRLFGRVSITLIVLLIGGCVAENLRGHYVWKKYRQEWEAKGERFDLASFIPKAVPPEQNFAATPFFAPFLDYTIDENDREHPYHWKDKESYERNRAQVGWPENAKQKKASDSGQWELGTFTDLRLWQDYFAGDTNFPFATTPKDPASDVLTALRRYDGVLDEIRAAGARPYSIFPVHYDEHYQALLPHLAALKNLGVIVRLRASARLAANHPGDALQDVRLGLRLADALKSEHFLISSLVRIRLAELTLQPIWEGLAHHRWNEPQLAELQAALAQMNILEDYGPTLRLERAAAIHAIDLIRTGKHRNLTRSAEAEEQNIKDSAIIRRLPGGVFRQNQFTIAWYYQERLLPLVDPKTHWVDVDGVNRAGGVRESTRYHPYALFANLLVPPVSKSATRFARAQAGLDLALIGCALERYRLEAGRYPDALDALRKYLPKIPPDVISGEPLKYRLTNDGRFLLYSVGWNETDDGGMPGLTERMKKLDRTTGDWVWSYTVQRPSEGGP
jgi:hypothetical protein